MPVPPEDVVAINLNVEAASVQSVQTLKAQVVALRAEIDGITNNGGDSSVLEIRLAAAEAKLATILPRLTAVETSTNSLTVRVDATESAATVLTARVTALETSTPVDPPVDTPVGPPPGVFVMPKTGAPGNPNGARVWSPNPSPVAKAENLTGPRYTLGPGSSLEEFFNNRVLPAGSVVTIARGLSWNNDRVNIHGQGTPDQPVLIRAGDGTGTLPTVRATKGGRYKDDGVINIINASNHVHLQRLRVADTVSIGFGVNGANSVLDECESSKVVIFAWFRDGHEGGRGNGSKAWNCMAADGVMMSNTPGPADDYGASMFSVEAHDVVVQGGTAFRMRQPSPDYDRWGGDGSLCDVWRKGDNLELAYCAVYDTLRVLEAGGLGANEHALNMRVHGIYATLPTANYNPIYMNPDGPYANLRTTGFQAYANTFVKF